MKILFVCLGNICRSPAAEAVMQAKALEAGYGERVLCDSAGTSAYHQGEPADPRMIKHGAGRGFDLTSISRQFVASDDFSRFDLIVTMDDQNYRNVLKQAQDDSYAKKVRKMVDYQRLRHDNEVPDPYYGGERGFEDVFDILEDACDGLLGFVEQHFKR